MSETQENAVRYPIASDEPLGVIEANECTFDGSLCTDRFRRLFNEIESLRTALENTCTRTDGDGRPCWCCSQIELASLRFKIEHHGFCIAAREVLERTKLREQKVP